MNSFAGSENFQLRELNRADFDLVLKWRNSERIRQISLNQNEISREDHERWFQSVEGSEEKKVFVCELDQRPIGIVQFFDIHREDRTAFWGFYLGETSVPKGSGTEMLRLALDRSFEDLEIEHIRAEILYSNPKSYFFHLKLGFAEESRAENVSENVIAMRLTKERWLERRQWLATRGENKCKISA